MVLMTCWHSYSVLEACISHFLSFSVLLLEQNLYTDIHLSFYVSSFCLSLTLALTPFLVFCFSVSDLMLFYFIFFSLWFVLLLTCFPL